MGVRAIKVRIECNRETIDHLWRTHRAYNDRICSLISKLLAMRRGTITADPTLTDAYNVWIDFVLSRPARDAVYLLNAVSIKGWTPNTALKMLGGKLPADPLEQKRVEAERKKLTSVISTLVDASKIGTFAYDKLAERDGLPDSIYQPLIRDTLACLSSHEELTKLWRVDRAKWVEEKSAWEADEEHRKYLAVRPLFEAFEASVGGKASKRRGRWHLYFEWLKRTPALAAWRGEPSTVIPIDAAAQARVAKAHPRKRQSVEAEEFWRINPELHALDRLHGEYERRFIRRRKSKKNRITTGFSRPPTFTLPDPVRHPRWPLFNGPQTSPEGYQNLVLPSDRKSEGSIELRLLTGTKADGTHPNRFVPLRFKADARLSCFSSKQETRVVTKGRGKGSTVVSDQFYFRDDQLRIVRKAEISGAKLIFDDIKLNTDGSLKSASPFVVFACTIEDQPVSEAAKAIAWQDAGPSGKGRRKLPEGLVCCSVDLGLRNLGFATTASLSPKTATHRRVQVIRSRNLRLEGGPKLAEIASHKKKIRGLRRLRGKPVRGEMSHIGLQDHIEAMGRDRFKKAARAIVNFALNSAGHKDRSGKVFPRADVIVLERLAGFIPDAERERGINRALASWNRAQLVERVKEMATDAGYKNRVYEVHPAGTSQCCSRCGEVGRRYTIVKRDNASFIEFGWVGKLFACAKCHYRANADHNASINLHHVFSETNAMSAFYAWRELPEKARRQIISDLDEALLHLLQAEHGLRVDLPF
jgi:transposase